MIEFKPLLGTDSFDLQETTFGPTIGTNNYVWHRAGTMKLPRGDIAPPTLEFYSSSNDTAARLRWDAMVLVPRDSIGSIDTSATTFVHVNQSLVVDPESSNGVVILNTSDEIKKHNLPGRGFVNVVVEPGQSYIGFLWGVPGSDPATTPASLLTHSCTVTATYSPRYYA